MLTQSYTNSIEKIIFGKNVYSKNILKLKKTKKIGLLDFYTDHSNVIIPEYYNYKVGESTYYEPTFFKHKNYKSLKFEGFLAHSSLGKDYLFALRMLQLLKSLTIKDKINKLILTYPVKGGMFGYSLGLSGFMPKSHVTKTLIKSVLFKFLKAETLSLKLFFYGLHEACELLAIYLPFRLGSVSLLSLEIRNNFSLKNKKKKRKNSTEKLSIVFLAYK